MPEMRIWFILLLDPIENSVYILILVEILFYIPEQ